MNNLIEADYQITQNIEDKSTEELRSEINTLYNQMEAIGNIGLMMMAQAGHRLNVIKARLGKNQNNSIATMAAVIFGTLVMFLGGIVSFVVPQDEFEQDEFFPTFRTEIRQFLAENIEDIKFVDGNNDMPAVIAGGALGHVDELNFSDTAVLKA